MPSDLSACEGCGEPTDARWCSTRCQKRSDAVSSAAHVDAGTRELLTAAFQLHPELLRAMDDHEAGRPIPSWDRIGNTRRAA